MQNDGHVGVLLFMKAKRLRQIKIADRVAADDDKIVSVQKIGAGSHTAGRTHGFLLYEIMQRRLKLASVTQGIPDRFRQIHQRQGHVADLIGAQLFNDPVQNGFSQQRNHRFRKVRGQRAQAPSLSPGKNTSFHVTTVPFQSMKIMKTCAGKRCRAYGHRGPPTCVLRFRFYQSF